MLDSQGNQSTPNNLSHCPYTKETQPDILRNLESKDNFEKNYTKSKIGDGSEKPLNVKPDEVHLSEEEREKREQYAKPRKIKRALCFAAWVFCVPCMLIGLSRREAHDPDDRDEDMRDDPCYPCYYDPYYNPLTPSSSPS